MSPQTDLEQVVKDEIKYVLPAVIKFSLLILKL